MSNTTNYSRRKFLKTSGIMTGGLLVSFVIPVGAKKLRNVEDESQIFTPNAYLQVGADNSIKITLAHVEMGQGMLQLLPKTASDLPFR